MKKIIYLLSFLLLVFILDYCVGVFFDTKLQQLPPDGERIAKSTYALKKVKSDVIIIGSSRAETGYIPTLMMDSLPQYSVYNCGGDGQDFYYCNLIINSILDRHTPKCIIWDFKEKQLGGEKSENLSLLYPHYWTSPRIKNSLDKSEEKYFRFKIQSHSFRYNATAGRILRSIYFPNKAAQNTYGFGPRAVKQNNYLVPKDFLIEDTCSLNKDKVEEFTATLRRAKEKGTKIIVVVSPMYNIYNQNNVFTRNTEKLCIDNGAFFIDDSHLDNFSHNNALSYDSYHLNVDGATQFTNVLIRQIRPILQLDLN